MNTISIIKVFNRRKKLNTKGEGAIELYIYQKEPKIKKYISTGITVAPKFWNEDKKVVVKHFNAPHYNKFIEDKIKNINDFYYLLYAQGQQLTAKQLENFYKSSEAVNNTNFIYFVEQYVAKKPHVTNRAGLFLLKNFGKQIKISDLSVALIEELDAYMKDKRKLKQTSIHRMHVCIKHFIRQAINANMLPPSKDPYLLFKAQKGHSRRTALTNYELKTLEQIDITTEAPELKTIYYAFLFSCYTGLRYSDIAELQLKHIKHTKDGKTIVKRMKKVQRNVILPIEILFDGKPAKILDMFIGDQTDPEAAIFPFKNYLEVNFKLKKIAQIAKLNTNLTFHVARHTFGTQLAEITQNPYLIMQLMGHTSINTSMIYIHLSSELIGKQLRTIKWN